MSYSLTSARRLVLTDAFEVDYQAIETGPLAPGEFLLETQFSLISPGTELAFYTGTHHGLKNPHNTWAKYPFSPGYASVGQVIEAGADAGVEVGETLFTPSPHASHFRIQGQEGVDFYKLSPQISREMSLFARLAAISMTATAVAPAYPGERVAVLGLGLIGNLAAQLYQQAGANVVGIDTVSNRLEIAQQCGISQTLNTSDNLNAQLQEIFGAEADLVIEATGVPQLTNIALQSVRRRGRVVLLGSPRGSLEIDIYAHIHARGTQLMGAHEGLHGTDGLPSHPELTLDALQRIEAGNLVVPPLLTHHWKADDARGAYDMLLNAKNGALGVVLEW